MDFQLKLSIIILNYNVKHFLELCLRSVIAATVDIDSEIIVVDNNSSDGSCDRITKLFPEIILLKNDKNLGFSKGNNIGVKKAKGEFICILNPDTVIAEDTFKKVMSCYGESDNIGIVGCKLVNGMGFFLPESKRNIPYPIVALKKFLGNSNHYYANHLSKNENGSVDILVGAFMFMKKEVFNLTNGFDEDFFMYGEDIDLSYRIKKLGYKNYYCGETTIIHYKGESTLRDENYLKRFFGAMDIFYKKHFKKNFFVDLFVQLGIKIVFMLDKNKKILNKNVENYVLISDNYYPNLEKVLAKPLVTNRTLINISKSNELIFDANYMSYKNIIEYMANNYKIGVTYKILPNNSSFILGSNTGMGKGEIFEF